MPALQCYGRFLLAGASKARSVVNVREVARPYEALKSSPPKSLDTVGVLTVVVKAGFHRGRF